MYFIVLKPISTQRGKVFLNKTLITLYCYEPMDGLKHAEE